MNYIDELLKDKCNNESASAIEFCGAMITREGVKCNQLTSDDATTRLSNSLKCFVNAMQKLEED